MPPSLSLRRRFEKWRTSLRKPLCCVDTLLYIIRYYFMDVFLFRNEVQLHQGQRCTQMHRESAQKI